ncbi:hypothetical protein BpHYR1_049301 [Brachionus plicatilis]|uniref:Uncharacterized protein n=1 Tax=Brachionus plicatilis TaxID=10195 RepID=A0A3M7SEE6_BRAPC|nr:hypothetical protein BpHYR1_049301 [Brachionus plicatilis]
MMRLFGGDGGGAGTAIAISVATISSIIIATAVVGTVIALALIPVYGSSSSSTSSVSGDGSDDGTGGGSVSTTSTSSQTFVDHTQSVTSITIVDKKIVSASRSKIVIRNTETNLVELEIKVENVTSVKFINSTTLITVSEDRKLTYYSLETGQELKTVSLVSYGSLTSLLVTSDQKIIIVTESKTILVLDRSGTIVKQILVCEEVTSMSLLSSGNFVYSTQNSIIITKSDTYEIDREIKITGKISYMVVAKATSDFAESIVYSSEYSVFVVSTSGVFIREIKSWESISGITQLSTGLIAVSIENYVLVYNISTGLVISTFTLETNSRIVVIETNGTGVICGTESGSIVVIFEFESFSSVNVSSLTVTNVTISTVSVSSKYKILSCFDGKFYVYEKSSGTSLFTYSFDIGIISTEFLLFNKALIVTRDGTTRIYNIETKEFEKSYSFGFQLYKCLIFSTNILLFTDLTGSIYILDSSLTIIKTLSSHSSAASLYSLDSYSFATYHGTLVKIWSSESFSLEREFNLETNIFSLFKINTGELVTVNEFGFFSIWSSSFQSFSFGTIDFDIQVTSCKKLNSDRFLIGTRSWLYEYSLTRRRIMNIFAINVYSFSFDFDFKIIIGSSYGQVNVLQSLQTFYEYDSLKSTWSIAAHNTSVTCLAVSQTKILSGDQDGYVVISDKISGKIEHVVSAFEKPVFSVHFVDNEFAFTMCNDGCLSVIKLENGEIVKSSGLSDPVSGSLVLFNGDILVGDVNGFVFVLDIDLNVKKSFSAHTGYAKIPTAIGTTQFVTLSANSFKVWKVSDYTMVSETRTETTIFSMVVLSNGNIVSVSQGGTITIWIQSSSRFKKGRQTINENQSVKVSELENKNISSLNTYPNDDLLVGSNDSLLKYNVSDGTVKMNNQVDNTVAVLDSDGAAFYGTESGRIFLGESNNTSSDSTTTEQTFLFNSTEAISTEQFNSTQFLNESSTTNFNFTSTDNSTENTTESDMLFNSTEVSNGTTAADFISKLTYDTSLAETTVNQTLSISGYMTENTETSQNNSGYSTVTN